MKNVITHSLTAFALVVAGQAFAAPAVQQDDILGGWENPVQGHMGVMFQTADDDQAALDPQEQMLWMHPVEGQMTEQPEVRLQYEMS